MCVYLIAALLLLIGFMSTVWRGSWGYKNTTVFTRPPHRQCEYKLNAWGPLKRVIALRIYLTCHNTVNVEWKMKNAYTGTD